MATFAIFYTRQDLTAIAAESTNPGLTPQERQEANRYWNAGLRDWATSPTAPEAQACVNIPFDPTGQPGYEGMVITNNGNGTWKVCDPNLLVVVVSGTQVSKAGLVAWLRTIGNKYPGALYMLAIADDVERIAIEPWIP
jgi:hypothetical protein